MPCLASNALLCDNMLAVRNRGEHQVLGGGIAADQFTNHIDIGVRHHFRGVGHQLDAGKIEIAVCGRSLAVALRSGICGPRGARFSRLRLRTLMVPEPTVPRLWRPTLMGSCLISFLRRNQMTLHIRHSVEWMLYITVSRDGSEPDGPIVTDHAILRAKRFKWRCRKLKLSVLETDDFAAHLFKAVPSKACSLLTCVRWQLRCTRPIFNAIAAE